ncbi:DUF4234 domain-containing protein [Microbacterium sp. NEAU-LLC]|uniref:DUF4234 domain-containing protein n=1 Tax=Microbacterium helvum TaxID=2773713 RepID=A0ABR8NLU8_9MICO|nr:DUF4234 domain-containing protein [Microbacterium helvum]MBD3941641.1 DUF4234 domain-containing protein [Microbacterium helvum]
MTMPANPQPISPEAREAALAQAVVREVAARGRVESQTAHNAIIVTGKRPNHVLHLILTIVTGGLWGIVWIIVALSTREHRLALSVDAYGNIVRQQLT